LQDLLALQDLQRHIAQPCSRDLLEDYLDTLHGLVEGTKYDWIREIAKVSLNQGRLYHKYLTETNQEPSSAV
jgi:hypothetical protein